MDCCQRAGYDEHFGVAQARKDLKRFQADGPDPTTRALIDALRKAGLNDATLLDIGGGVGAIHHELLDAGAASATHVDVSDAYIQAARGEARRRGHADRVRFIEGDFVEVAPMVEPADVVTLDRVICCYGDMESLVRESASRSTRFYGAVFPRDWWFLGLAFRAINLFKQLTRSSFRVYLHPVAAIDAAIRREGLQPRTQLRTFVWNVVVYARAG